ncbi:MAG: TonB family protein [Acidobacteriota bacterium]
MVLPILTRALGMLVVLGGLGVTLPARAEENAEALARLRLQAGRHELRQGAAGFHLRAEVHALRLFDGVRTGAHVGEYLLWFESDRRWREEIRFRGYTEAEIHLDGDIHLVRPVDYVPVRVHQLRRLLDQQAHFERRPGEMLTAVDDFRQDGLSISRFVFGTPGGAGRRLELESGSGFLRTVREDRLGFDYRRPQEISGRTWPGIAVVRDDEGPLVAFRITKVEELDRLPPELARVSDDASGRSATAVEVGDDGAGWRPYRERLRRIVHHHWRLPSDAMQGREGVVELGFAIRPDGEVQDLRLERSSGNLQLDRAALTAVSAAAPLPSPPGAVEGPVPVSWQMRYNLDEASAGVPRELPPPLPRMVTGDAPAELAHFDEVLLAFLERERVPGAALAVVRHGRLLMSRGYGWADFAAGEPVQADSLFRVGSLSKPWTSVAILQLVDEGRLSLDRPLLDQVDWARSFEDVDPRWRRVTVRQLLQHRGGLDRNLTPEPTWSLPAVASDLGLSRALEPRDLITWRLSRPLDFEPGERFAYSNFGYVILGALLEELTGQSLEERIRERVLDPIDVVGPRLGRTAWEDRASSEVRPHSRADRLSGTRQSWEGPSPHEGWSLELLAPAAGWLASAENVALFASTFDRPRRCPLLPRRLIRQLWARPPGLAGHDRYGRMRVRHYGCGFQVRTVGYWGEHELSHEGLLPGSSSLLISQPDGVQAVVLFNQDRGADGVVLSAAIAPVLRELLRGVDRWPDLDLRAGRR